MTAADGLPKRQEFTTPTGTRSAEKLIEFLTVLRGGLVVGRVHEIFVNRAAESIEPGPVLGDGLLLIGGKKT